MVAPKGVLVLSGAECHELTSFFEEIQVLELEPVLGCLIKHLDVGGAKGEPEGRATLAL